MSEESITREMHIPLETGRPRSLDEAERSVEVVCASETPVREMNFDDYRVQPTSILMGGCELPANGQLPLLDNHSRYSASSVIGSVRNLRIEGDQLVGRAYFSASPDVEPIWQRIKEGHLTDLSISRKDISAEYISEGASKTVLDRVFVGPLRVVSKWRPGEVSVTPIGADATAKMRSLPHNSEDKSMPAKQVENGAPTQGATREEEIVNRADTEQNRSPQDSQAARPGLSFQDGLEAVARCERLGIDAADRAAILDGATDRAAIDSRILAFLEQRGRASMPAAAAMPTPAPATVAVDEREKLRSAMTDSLLVRAHCLGDKTPAAGAAEFGNWSLMELARQCLKVAGQPTGGGEMEMVGRAFLYSDLKNILDNVSGKIFETAFQAAPSRWREWCSEGTVPDFRLQTLVTVGGLSDLDKIEDDVGYQYGRLRDEAWTFQVETWGKLYAIYRHMIVNNQWGLIEEMNRLMGETAARKLGDLPYNILAANPRMKDGHPLFDAANHNNVIANAKVGLPLFGQALVKAGLQKDFGTGRSLGIRLKNIIAPLSLEGTLEGFFATNQFVENSGQTSRANIYAGQRFTRIYDARLDDADPKTFYMLAENRTVRMFFLQGRQDPYIETREGWTVDGTEYKVRIDASAVPMSYQTMVKITLQ